MADQNKRYLNPESMHAPTGYTHVVETTGMRTVYIAGQIALDPQGNLVGLGDMAAQAEQVFRNLDAALKAVGARFGDVVKVTYFITDMTQAQAVRTMRDRYFPPDRLPAGTLVEVSRLARDEFLLEIEAIAVLD